MARKATRQKARTTKGWAKRAPKTQKQRRALLARCGKKAFLLPSELKYPIMAKGTKTCAIDCQGLRAAKSRLGAMVTKSRRAGQTRAAAKYRRAQTKVSRLGKSVVCHWAG